MLLHDLLVHGSVHLLIGGHEVEAADLAIAYRAPYHDLWMFDGSPDDARVVSGDGRRSADKDGSPGVSPELHMCLIREEDLPPAALGPGSLPLGPAKAALLLKLGELGLDADRDAADLAESRDLPLEAVRSEERIILKMFLDPPLNPVGDLAVVTAGPRILGAGGGTDEGAIVDVSSCLETST